MDWQLKSLSIEYMSWGELKGKYVGKINFQNNNSDAFTFTLTPEECAQYLSLISKKVATHASQLGQQVNESMNIKLDATDCYIAPGYSNKEITVELSNVYPSDVLEHFNVKEIISNFPIKDLLDGIGADECKIHFDLVEKE